MDLKTFIKGQKLLTIEQLEKLPTKRLITYYKKYIRGRGMGVSDDYVIECDCETCMNEKEWIAVINEYREEAKKIMNGRENV